MQDFNSTMCTMNRKEGFNTKFDIIAEIGQAHEGSLGMAHSYIDMIAKSGVSAIKFQTHIAEAESSIHEPFRINFSYEDNCRYDYWKRMEFTEEQWIGLKNHCDDLNVEFLSSPFSIKAVELLEKIGVKRYKIGSGEVSNLLMLEYIAKTKKPVILSSGLSDVSELDRSISFLKEKKIVTSILQCTTMYPTHPEDWELDFIPFLKKRYNLPIGYSDHSGDIYACLFAAAKGAEIFEFHAVFDKDMFGPDSKSSLTPREITKLVEGLKCYEKSISIPFTESKKDDNLKSIFEKSLAINKNLPEGHILRLEDLESKKPRGMGISAKEFTKVIGRKLNREMIKWEFINLTDLKDE